MANPQMNLYKNNGFTLVELSIVLLILGLLISGTLVGKDLIRAAELRSITVTKDEMQTKVNLFKEKYQGLPGDLSNATAFWGVMPTGTCNTSAAGASGGTGTQTCNGDGNGMISGANAVGSNPESHLFWQHLSNAGLIEGRYTGVQSATVSGEYISTKMQNGLWNTWYMDDLGVDSTWMFQGVYRNLLELYNSCGSVPDCTTSPAEQWNIDKKIDDGMPGTGKLVSRESAGVNCNTLAASAATPATSYTYNLTYSVTACRPVFRDMW